MEQRRLTRRALLCGAAGATLACRSRSGSRERDARSVVFKYQPLWGDPAPFRARLEAFERSTGVRVVTEVLPNASDVLHQYYLTSLEGGASDFDVLVIDVVWVAEFARAGWIADLSAAFPPEVLRRDLVPGAAEAVIMDGRTYAMPWYADVGLLYRRTDLVRDPPRTYAELDDGIGAARRSAPELQGYLFQGRQAEGLVCNAYEAIWGHGGASLEDGRLALDTEATRRGVGWLRAQVANGLSPTNVLSAEEEESRRAFQSGRAVFMRNWPYALAEAQGPASPIRGRVAVSPLPTVSGEPGSGTLGGWQLAINAQAPPDRREAAIALVTALTSLEANVDLAVQYARNPPRVAAYEDPRLVREAPFIASLLPMLRHARPRPVTPFYGMLTDILQSEFSAAVSGVRTPADALSRAQVLADHVMGLR